MDYQTMNTNTNSRFYGVPEGVYYGQNERVDEVNDRISSRQFSDQPLQPSFDMRPMPTKYSLFPVINRRKEVKEQLHNYPDYNCKSNFNPATTAPPCGFFNHIDIETNLRNQQINKPVFVPELNGDLYKVKVVSRHSVQPHSLLFTPLDLYNPNPNMINKNIGKDLFSNHTRTQLRSSIQSVPN
jgi:hypothetical protein